jgi:hypothetical protein
MEKGRTGFLAKGRRSRSGAAAVAAGSTAELGIAEQIPPGLAGEMKAARSTAGSTAASLDLDGALD